MVGTGILVFLFVSCRSSSTSEFKIGLFQINEAPTIRETRKGVLQALKDNGYFLGKNMEIITRHGGGEISYVQKIAEEFVQQRVDLIVALSTPCLQAAIQVTDEIPIVFASVANPILVGAGRSDDDHLPHVTGVSSRGPIFQNLAFIREVLPQAKKIGTLWTPAELNSEYYLDLVKKGAEKFSFEVIALPVESVQDVFIVSQKLVNEGIDVLFPISDNTLNASFAVVAQVATENRIPLFGANLMAVEQGACAAMGWDFYEMGYEAGQLVARVLRGENPEDIPFHYMEHVLLYLNLLNAQKQGVNFPSKIIARADRIIGENLISGEK
ncbi:MAG: hypothetical protein B5M54_03785 [Candidatus Aminicenantes bacterium 4484_214]|nr:MAG: hypothetical protein B5M54_03785 [Candidatus Aminicenantes bacterium 4484_214]RLE08480.1 MAG: hypothetical protein DRJ06_04490 [Candidatus Aminicenantes bacterium]